MKYVSKLRAHESVSVVDSVFPPIVVCVFVVSVVAADQLFQAVNGKPLFTSNGGLYFVSVMTCDVIVSSATDETVVTPELSVTVTVSS